MEKKDNQKSAVLEHPAQVKETHAAKGQVIPTAKTMAASATPGPIGKVSEEAIQVRAYHKWEAAGKPKGDDMRFWLQAEQELKNNK